MTYYDLMLIKNIKSVMLAITTTVLLSACSAHYQWEYPPNPIKDLNKETADLADVTADVLDLNKRAGSKRVLVVFDIDNTLLAMEQGLGADQWYDWQKEINSNDKCSIYNVGDRFSVQGALYFASAMRPTQEDAASQIKAIQETGAPVIALTSRGQDYRLQTFRELRRNGYSFSHSAIGPAGGYADPFVPVENGRVSRYEDGVFLTAGQHKGQMLNALLQKTDIEMPDVIVMTDDKQKNLDAVKETFLALGVPVHAWRYTAEDENVQNFDPELADSQWKSIENALHKIQQILGPDNYNLDSATRSPECD
jgi:hypothetical protein